MSARGQVLLRDQTFRLRVVACAVPDGVDSSCVFLGIVRSMNLCSLFGRVMDRKTRSESFWCCGSSKGNLLLIVGTGRRQGQWKDAGEDDRC